MTNSSPAEEWAAVVRIAECSGDRRHVTVSAGAVLHAHAQIEASKVEAAASLKAMRRAVLALAFAAETSPAMRDDYNALSAAIERAAEIEGEAA